MRRSNSPMSSRMSSRCLFKSFLSPRSSLSLKSSSAMRILASGLRSSWDTLAVSSLPPRIIRSNSSAMRLKERPSSPISSLPLTMTLWERSPSAILIAEALSRLTLSVMSLETGITSKAITIPMPTSPTAKAPSM